MTSSASQPGFSTCGTASPSTTLRIQGSCSLRSSGIGGRVDLYFGSIACRTALPSRSQTSATWVGEASRSDFSSIRVKP